MRAGSLLPGLGALLLAGAWGCGSSSAFQCVPCASDSDCALPSQCRGGYCIQSPGDELRCPHVASSSSAGSAAASSGTSAIGAASSSASGSASGSGGHASSASSSGASGGTSSASSGSTHGSSSGASAATTASSASTTATSSAASSTGNASTLGGTTSTSGSTAGTVGSASTTTSTASTTSSTSTSTTTGTGTTTTGTSTTTTTGTTGVQGVVSGAACTSDAPCGTDGYCEMGAPWPGGYCTGSCDSDASVCNGGECVLYSTGAFCDSSCAGPRSGQSTCRTNYVCDYWYDDTGNVAADGICVTNCAIGGAGCAAGYICNLQGFCDPQPLGAGVPGAICSTDANCTDADAYCGTPLYPDGGGNGWPGGYCLADCDFSPPGVCGPTGTCASFGGYAICQQQCSNPGGGRGVCRNGYLCWSYYLVDGGISADGACQPPCQDPTWGCGAGSTCKPSGYCQ